MIRPDLSRGVEPLTGQNFHILALSGGGFRGLFTASILEEIERLAKAQCRDMFDLIAGTSIGGIIALGLSAGVPAADIRATIERAGPEIFDPRLRLGKWRLPFASPVRPLFKTKYNADGLAGAIGTIIGEDLVTNGLACLATPTVVVSVNHSYGRPEIFRSYDGIERPASQETIMAAALATSAAPGYFPPRRMPGGTVIDGGVIANAPDLLALTDAMSDFQAPAKMIRIMSIGTASPEKVQSAPIGGRPGHVGWIARRRLFQTTMAAQERMAVQQASVILHDRYLRIDRSSAGPDVSALGLDRADSRAISVLRRLAAEAWSETTSTNALLLGHFCRHRRPSDNDASRGSGQD